MVGSVPDNIKDWLVSVLTATSPVCAGRAVISAVEVAT